MRRSVQPSRPAVFRRVDIGRDRHGGSHPDAHRTANEENTMPKGLQRNNKESKKPKKDASPAKPMSPGAIMPTVVTVVPERGKKKK
jgi:hypothetical protein